MHNLYAIFAKFLEICNQFSKDLVNELGNITRRGVVPKISDLQVIALSLTAETLSIDSENNLFNRLTGYKAFFPNMISRRQFNDRRKFTGKLCETIRKRIADCIDGGEEYFCIDSKPIEVCRIYRLNQKEWKPLFIPFAKARKRIETVFSQLTDQFMLIRNYAKETKGLFARIIGKISALTILQYINKSNNNPIGRVKYALS